ncbi:MAG TPA: hydrogenase formation protein HypD [Flavobacteriales bacterium]|jgi:hydrogenase expression/formation protein HypD|nr:hydrogenase formation protein HypD [Flavobacteriales bacterium]
MKYLDEYRDPKLARLVLDKIFESVSRPWSIMEICGGQTHSLVKNGILEILPKEITMIHGPGCPVCVTPINLIDKAILLAENANVILCSFGDMVRVPGSRKSLLQSKSEGSDIRIVYSPLEAVKLASQNPDKEVVFFAVGFETTAPTNALSVVQAAKMGLANYSILTSHVLVPPALNALLSDPESTIDGVLAAGHVCTVMGFKEYYPIAKKYKTPIVITGFEPVDLLQGILTTIEMLENQRFDVINEYGRVVEKEGNPHAMAIINEAFEVSDRKWRGVGNIDNSGYQLREKYQNYDADLKFAIKMNEVEENAECIAGSIMKGQKKPIDCIHFGKKCNPENPLGAPMVSSEGACAAYYHFSHSLFQNVS